MGEVSALCVPSNDPSPESSSVASGDSLPFVGS